jgi:hypothetical protein
LAVGVIVGLNVDQLLIVFIVNCSPLSVIGVGGNSW